MVEVEDLRCFVEVVESGGFGRAALKLGVAKSILSRRIARMEAALGTRLLDRTARGVSATEAGAEFRQRSERILAELDEATAAMAERSGEVAGRLRVSIPNSFGVRHIAPLLAELAARHPRLELDVEFSDRFADLVGDRFDAAVRIGTLRDSSLVARRIAPARGTVVGSPAYFARHGRPAVPEDIEKHECLIYTGGSGEEGAGNWPFRSGRRTIAVRPRGRLRTASGEAILEWATAGLGLAYLPSFLASDAIAEGALEPALLDYPSPEIGIYALRPPGPHPPTKVRVFIDALVERFSGVPYWDRCLGGHSGSHPRPPNGTPPPAG